MGIGWSAFRTTARRWGSVRATPDRPIGSGPSTPREGLSSISLVTAASNSAETDAIELGCVDRSEAKRAMASTADRVLAERELKDAEFSCSAIIKPVAQAEPAK